MFSLRKPGQRRLLLEVNYVLFGRPARLREVADDGQPRLIYAGRKAGDVSAFDYLPGGGVGMLIEVKLKPALDILRRLAIGKAERLL